MHTIINHTAAKKLTIKAATQILRDIGCSISHRDREFRVNLKGGTEATAYYTDDLSDAVFTAIHMANERTARKIADINATIADFGAIAIH